MSYNGWRNYATWRVMLEMFDGQSPEDAGIAGNEPHIAADILREYADEIIFSQAGGIALDYARAFLSEVDWREIAEHILESEEVEV